MSKRKNNRLRRFREIDVNVLETALIMARALHQETVYYETLQQMLGGVSPPILWDILKRSTQRSIAEDRPILASMAVGRSGLPGAEFYDHLRSFGLKVGKLHAAEEAAWREQHQRVLDMPVIEL